MHNIVAAQITNKAFYLERLIRNALEEKGSVGTPISLLHVEVLTIIAEHKGVTMKQLADKLHISAPSATSLVSKLVEANYIKRLQDPSNRRLVRLALTPLGSEIHKESIAKCQEAMTKILSVLPESDQKDLLRIYEILIQSLQ